jgi:hypothetical protein
MRCKPPETRFYVELKDLNAAFLGLITDKRLNWHGSLFGLDSGVTAGLRALSATELDFIASTPGPLAGFANLPSANIVAESRINAGPADDRWMQSTKTFATELAMYLWQTARHDRFAATLCIGPANGRVGQLADMSFREIQDRAGTAVNELKAQLGPHKRFWPDLIRAARGDDRELRFLSRMAVFPLLVAESRFNGLR